MKKQEGRGLVALLGIGAGLYAWWRYRNMSPERKEELRAKASDVGRKIKDTVSDIESNVSQKYKDLKNTAKGEISDLQSNATQKYDHLKNSAKREVNDVTH